MLERKGKSKEDRGRRPNRDSEEEFEQRVIDLARVTRVMAGGKRMRFRACVALGDKKGRVAVGLAKGVDVTVAINKAVNSAKKDFIHVEIINDTILHDVHAKYKAAAVLLRPAERGKGIVAGGAMRQVLELAGIPNVVGKILGSKNKINTTRATLKALASLKKSDQSTFTL